jgi:tetratricopeptide (TPR) repeat protein
MRLIFATSLSAASLFLARAAACAGGQFGLDVSDTEIKIGGIVMPGLTFAPEASFAASESQSCSQEAGNDHYGAVVIACTRAIALNPNNAFAYTNPCAAHVNLGNYDEAVVDCTRAITLDATDPLAYSNRCGAYVHLGKNNDAVADCTHAIALSPTDVLAYTNRCGAYINFGNYSAGIADCTQAIALSPKSARAFINRCAANIKLGNYNDAVGLGAGFFFPVYAGMETSLRWDPFLCMRRRGVFLFGDEFVCF